MGLIFFIPVAAASSALLLPSGPCSGRFGMPAAGDACGVCIYRINDVSSQLQERTNTNKAPLFSDVMAGNGTANLVVAGAAGLRREKTNK